MLYQAQEAIICKDMTTRTDFIAENLEKSGSQTCATASLGQKLIVTASLLLC